MYYVQYLLFPRLLEATPEYEYVIVNFDSGHIRERHLTAAENGDARKSADTLLRLRRDILKQQHLVVKKDFGDGVLLCRREGGAPKR